MHIIIPGAYYDLALQLSGLQSLEDRRDHIDRAKFAKLKDPKHRLNCLLSRTPTLLTLTLLSCHLHLPLSLSPFSPVTYTYLSHPHPSLLSPTPTPLTPSPVPIPAPVVDLG